MSFLQKGDEQACLENHLKCLKKLLSDSRVDVIGSQTYFCGLFLDPFYNNIILSKEE
jgi:hypothetical protein